MRGEALYENKMIQRLLLPTVLFHLVCGLAKAGELPEINFVKIVFLSGWTKSGKFKLVWPEHAPQALRCARGRGRACPVLTGWPRSFINDFQKLKRRRKGYEKADLFLWNWFTFRFDGIHGLCVTSIAKNSHHKK
jgi:hypothetical protein